MNKSEIFSHRWPASKGIIFSQFPYHIIVETTPSAWGELGYVLVKEGGFCLDGNQRSHL